MGIKVFSALRRYVVNQGLTCEPLAYNRSAKVGAYALPCLMSQGRGVFKAFKKEGTDLAEKVTGWEESPEKRQAITGELKKLGFRWAPQEKAWAPSAPVQFSEVEAILKTQNAISEGAPMQRGSTGKKSAFEGRVDTLLENWRDPLTKLLPRQVDQHRFFVSLRVALLGAERIAFNSTDASLYTTLSKCAQLGMTPSSLQECYFSSREGQIEFQIGYKGLIALARRASPGLQIQANVVRNGDDFSYTLGTNPTISLSQNPDADPEDIQYAYVLISFPGGASHLSVVDREHVKKRMDCAKGIGSYSSPWKKFPREMWLKTAIKDSLRFVDLSPEKSTKEELDAAIQNFKAVVKALNEELVSEEKSGGEFPAGIGKTED